MAVGLRKAANVALGLFLFYAVECTYILVQSDVVQGDVGLALICASIGFLPQALFLIGMAWLVTRLEDGFCRTQVAVMSLATVISSMKLIPWAQAADERYALSFDAEIQLTALDFGHHPLLNLGLLTACMALSYLLALQFRGALVIRKIITNLFR